MTHMDIEKLTLASRDREKEEQKRNHRKRCMTILIKHFLENNGFIHTAETLVYESKQAVEEYAVCDNIDLETILQDFETYHFLKYQKLPQIVKKTTSSSVLQSNFGKGKTKKVKQALTKPLSFQTQTTEQRASPSLTVSNRHSRGFSVSNLKDIKSDTDMYTLNMLNLPDSNIAEWKAMANFLIQDCCQSSRSVSWGDIMGHEHPKQLLKEAVIYPLKYNELFMGKISTWQSVLLYGPTGTGKTLLATVAATESQSKFFKVCLSTVVSKWRGESEKYVKVLFDLAKHFSPSVIFIDEIDALMSHRGTDHEASRRMKTEFFLQMDELTTSEKSVVLLTATNLPWELDYAVLRRIEKRILVDLPDTQGRVQLFKKFLANDVKGNKQVDFNFEELANATRNYSPAEILLVCKEAKMDRIRNIINVLESNEKHKIPYKDPILNSLKFSNVLSAIKRTKPATAELGDKYIVWKESHGSE